MELTSSVVEYPDRGPWGKSRYRGNTTGHIVKDLIDTYEPATVLDPMEGSSTTGDVCREYGIDYFGYDLNKGDNLLSPSTKNKMLREVEDGVDLIFWHPPYWNMIRYHEGNPNDFAHGSYQVFLHRMEISMKFLATLLSGRKESRLAILMGDLRRAGVYYWIPRDISTSEKLRSARLKLDALVIKKQSNVTSNNIQYASPLIRIMHETLLILGAA